MLSTTKRIYFIFFSSLSLFTGCKDIGTTEKAEVDLGQNSQIAERQVEKAVEILNAAMMAPQKETLITLAVPQLTYGHSSGKIQDRAQFVEDLVNGPFKFTDINVEDQTIHITGNTAVVRHIFNAEATNLDQPVSVHIGNLLVFQRTDDEKWLLLARQAFKL